MNSLRSCDLSIRIPIQYIQDYPTRISNFCTHHCINYELLLYNIKMLIRKTFIDLLIRKTVKLWHDQLRFFPPIFGRGNVVLNNSLVSCNQTHYVYISRAVRYL